MVFSSVFFTFLFLPIVLGGYYVTRNDRIKNLILLVASLFFYAYGEPKFIYVMLGSIVTNYVFALLIDKELKEKRKNGAKAFLVLDIFANLGLLFVFKYLCFTMEIFQSVSGRVFRIPEITLPIGISFFTFQAMSYVFDVYRGEAEVQKNPLHLALYISFFPQLIAGPIVRYRKIADEIDHERNISPDYFAYGCERFMTGFCKKVILANNLAGITDETFSFLDFAAAGHGCLYYWIGAIAYSLQIFFDFSGYSDMAIGLGAMFGFHFDENFNYPYMCSSVTDFWRRWHISLSGWFRDYVYIPLGGSRKGAGRQIFNMAVVWLCTGLWHGADYQFIAWGMSYLIFLILEKYVVKPENRKDIVKRTWQMITLCVVVVNWVLFRSVGIRQGMDYIRAMFGGYQMYATGMDTDVIRMLRDHMPYLILGIVFATPVAKRIREKLTASPKYTAVCGIVVPLGLFLAFLWAVSFLVMGAHNPFIYFNF